MEVVELEKSNDTSRVDDLDSIWWHLITNVVECKVDILEEELDGEETVKELSWGVVFEDLHPDLLLLAVGTLHEVVGVAEVHVIRPHAPEFVTGLAGVILNTQSARVCD